MFFFKKLHSQPKHIRIFLMWLSVFIFMSSVVLIWLVSLKSSLEKIKLSGKKEVDKFSENLNLPSLKENFGADISRIKRMIDQVNSSTKTQNLK